MTAGAPSRPPSSQPRLRTYSHLAARRKVPDEYDLATTGLHYYLNGGFEVNVPLSSWYQKHQQECALTSVNWDDFADPRRTTYTRYTSLARQREAHVDGVLRTIDETGYDGRLSPAWVEALDGLLGPLRFPFHGLQMVAAYVGSMAPGGRITIAAMFQAADEIRRIQRLTQRMVQLRGTYDAFGDRARSTWQEAPAWQPLRETVERLLLAYDWGEALVALNLCVKPMVDELFVWELAELALLRGDSLLGSILVSFSEDCRWQREWTRELLRFAVLGHPGNRNVVAAWMEKWMPRAEAAVRPFAFLFEDRGDAAIRDLTARVQQAASEVLVGGKST